jgi:hypothetical protein
MVQYCLNPCLKKGPFNIEVFLYTGGPHLTLILKYPTFSKNIHRVFASQLYKNDSTSIERTTGEVDCKEAAETVRIIFLNLKDYYPSILRQNFDSRYSFGQSLLGCPLNTETFSINTWILNTLGDRGDQFHHFSFEKYFHNQQNHQREAQSSKVTFHCFSFTLLVRIVKMYIETVLSVGTHR